MNKPYSSYFSCLGIFLIFLSFFPKPSLQQKPFPFPPLLPPLPSPKLFKSYIALQAWKHSITDDPKNITGSWWGLHVCNYTGVYCSSVPGDPHNLTTVAGIDINGGNVAGILPEELGLLTDLALFHINSNRFCGKLPESFRNLKLLHELDVSNNNFSSQFPSVVLNLPSLKFLDLRFNHFHGDVPSTLFDLKLDAIFINNNNFTAALPKNIGNSPVSVIVLANNNFNGCIPSSLYKMGNTLHELIIINSGLTGCLQSEIGNLNQLTVFDVSFNNLVGELPESIVKMKKLEQLNVAHNKFSGVIPDGICSLPNLENFTYSYNYFCGESKLCHNFKVKDDRKNCIVDRPQQRTMEECEAFYKKPIDCSSFGCMPRTPLSPPPPRSPPPPMVLPPPPPVYHPGWPHPPIPPMLTN
ncbi:hypothetical protein ACFE04_007013 [Oxalis oulophora]